jgi:hypothetical protein
MPFEHCVLNPGTVAAIYNGRPEKHTSDLQAPATPVVPTLKKAYSALKMRDIPRLVSYIPDEHKNVYDEILAWPVCNRGSDDGNWKHKAEGLFQIFRYFYYWFVGKTLQY